MAESWVFNRKLVHNADTGKRYLRITCDATAAVAKTFTVTQMGDQPQKIAVIFPYLLG